MRRLIFTVHGEALPAGSKQSYPVLDRQGEVVRTKTGRLLTRAKHANPKTADWMGHVATVAGEAMGGAPLFTGPVKLCLTFFRPRPTSHFGSGRNALVLKESAPALPTTRPDATKLTRAVEDSLKGIVWRDDSQVTSLEVGKRYGENYRVEIAVEEDDCDVVGA